MKYFILAVIALVLISCNQNSNNPTVQKCFSVSIGDKWVYNVTDINGQYQETHIVTDRISKIIHDLTFSAYTVNVSAPLRQDYTWFMFTKNDTLLIEPTINLEPIFNGNSNNSDTTLWFKFNFCTSDSFISKSISYDAATVIVQDILVNGIISHNYNFNFKKPSGTKYSLNSKDINADVYKYDLSYQEQIIKPDSAVFSDTHSRVRNQQNFSGEIWFSNEIGFLKIVSIGLTKQLVQYEKH
jgi:hypothetical protein